MMTPKIRASLPAFLAGLVFVGVTATAQAETETSTTAATPVEEPEEPLPEEVLWARANIDEGRRLFRSLCAGCHGRNGDGKVAVAQFIFPAPRDLTKGSYRFRSTESGSLPTREDMLHTLELGLPGTKMPGWKDQLSDGELRSLVLFLEELSPRFVDERPEPDEILVDAATVEILKPSPELLKRGKEIYELMKCGQCHGDDGRGDGKAADELKDSDGRRSHVFDFTYGVYKGGTTPLDVYRTFITGLNGTPMPSYSDSLPDERDRWAMVYYCLSLHRERGFWFYLSQGPSWEDLTFDEDPSADD